VCGVCTSRSGGSPGSIKSVFDNLAPNSKRGSWLPRSLRLRFLEIKYLIIPESIFDRPMKVHVTCTLVTRSLEGSLGISASQKVQPVEQQ
jgi:hypothetical protein